MHEQLLLLEQTVQPQLGGALLEVEQVVVVGEAEQVVVELDGDFLRLERLRLPEHLQEHLLDVLRTILPIQLRVPVPQLPPERLEERLLHRRLVRIRLLDRRCLCLHMNRLI